MAGVGTLVHCAGLAHHEGAADDYEQVNVRSAIALADAAVNAGCSRLIFVSSLNVVPAGTPNAASPAVRLPRPQDPYAESKWRAEQQLEALLQGMPVELVILRPALLYDQELVANLARLRRHLRSGILTLPAIGKRSMLARPDLVALVLSELKRPHASGGVRRLAVTDGECYDLKRIGRALTAGQGGWLPVPGWALRASGRFLDATQGLPAGTSWRGLAESKWCAGARQPRGAIHRWTLESLLESAP
jgi:nucleoside-diphosphate-sugar epimerase